MLQGCVNCCAPYTLVCSVLLFTMYAMIKTDSYTFAVLGAKAEWDAKEKARCCLHAAVVYIVISCALWFLVLLDALLINLGELANWKQFYQGSVGGTLAYLHRRRQDHRQLVKRSRQRRVEEFRAFTEEMNEMEGRVVAHYEEDDAYGGGAAAAREEEPYMLNTTPKTPLVQRRESFGGRPRSTSAPASPLQGSILSAPASPLQGTNGSRGSPKMVEPVA